MSARISDKKLRYSVTVDCDLMQIYNGEEVGTLGIHLSPDTAALFAAAPEMREEIDSLRAELEAAKTKIVELEDEIIRYECRMHPAFGE